MIIKNRNVANDRLGAGVLLLLKCCISVCLGDEGHPPVAPRPHLPGPHLGPCLVHLHAHAEPGVDVGGGMVGAPGLPHGRGDDPDLTPEVEEGTEEVDLGGDATEHAHGPTTENGTGRGTGGDTRLADEPGQLDRPTEDSLCNSFHH